MNNLRTNPFLVEYHRDFLAGKSACTGKILHIDLSESRFWLDEPPESFYRALIGGRGFILHYLLTQTPAGADPLGPENLLVFAAGLLTGTILPGSGRHAVGAKSPLTGALASGEAGGWWGHELKRAGFDALVVHGRAPQPVYLWIKDGAVEMRPAAHLWGLLTAEAQLQLRAELGDPAIRVAQIGPAGENLVRYASIMHDVNRAAGRSGLGAVMGSKNLKAVAVRGSKTVGLADKQRLKSTLAWITSGYKESMAWASSYGTAGSVGFNHDIGSTAIRNYQAGIFDGIDALRHQNFFPALVKERDSCSHCAVNCKIVVGQEVDPSIDSIYGGPEYESIGALGPLCAVSDPAAVAKANELCAAYGLDTISTGATIAFSMECAEKGLLDGADFQPHFGDGSALLEAIRRIAYREGQVGALMAEGSARMAAHLGGGAEQMLAVARGQEFPLHDPRFKNTTGLGYALSATGADHMHNLLDNFANFPDSDICARLREMGMQTPLPLFGISAEKVQAYIYETSFKNVLDSAVICHFYPYEYRHLAEALSAAGGWADFDAEEINQAGARIINLARLYLLREGSGHQHDHLSARAYHPLKEGPIAGRSMDEGELAAGLQHYFQFMGWDAEGRPGGEALERLGLEAYASPPSPLR
jgi:aldehyde:ferredoxin oxidoreductase